MSAVVLVPETAVNKYDLASRDKYQVWLPGKVLTM